MRMISKEEIYFLKGRGEWYECFQLYNNIEHHHYAFNTFLAMISESPKYHGPNRVPGQAPKTTSR